MKAKLKDVVPPFYDHRRDGLTQSLLSSYLSCRERASLSLEGLSPQARRAALDFGVMTHSALETIYRRAQELHPAPWLPDTPYLMELLTRLEADWEAANPLADPELRQETETHLGFLQALLPAYVNHWQEDFTGGIDWMHLESQFRVPAPGRPELSLVGKMDGAFQRGPKSLWLFETKTKSRIEPAALEDSLAINLQVQFYLYALALITGRKPRGVLYNVIRRPQLRLGKNEGFHEFIERVRLDIGERPAFYFMRWEVPVLEDEMRSFARDLTAMCDEFCRWREGELRTFKNGSACLSPYACQYLPICGTGSRQGFHKRERVFMELDV